MSTQAVGVLSLILGVLPLLALGAVWRYGGSPRRAVAALLRRYGLDSATPPEARPLGGVPMRFLGLLYAPAGNMASLRSCVAVVLPGLSPEDAVVFGPDDGIPKTEGHHEVSSALLQGTSWSALAKNPSDLERWLAEVPALTSVPNLSHVRARRGELHFVFRSELSSAKEVERALLEVRKVVREPPMPPELLQAAAALEAEAAPGRRAPRSPSTWRKRVATAVLVGAAAVVVVTVAPLAEPSAIGWAAPLLCPDGGTPAVLEVTTGAGRRARGWGCEQTSGEIVDGHGFTLGLLVFDVAFFGTVAWMLALGLPRPRPTTVAARRGAL